MSVTLALIVGRYFQLNSSAATGKFTFDLTYGISDGSVQNFPTWADSAVLDQNGGFALVLPSNEDNATLPQNTAYTVTPAVSGAVANTPWTMVVPNTGLATLLTGSTAPNSGTGSNGNYYLDTTTNTVYGPKVSGNWTMWPPIVVTRLNGQTPAGVIDLATVLPATLPNPVFPYTTLGAVEAFFNCLVPSGYAATDTANFLGLLDSLTGNGGTIRPQAGEIYLDEFITIPYGVNVWGEGNGTDIPLQSGGPATHFICTNSSAGIGFGTRTTASRGGKSGNFCVDGNNVSDLPLYIGFVVERTFDAIDVVQSAGVGCLWEAAQNCTVTGFESSHHASVGIVFDYGCGNNRIYGAEIRNNGGDGTGNVLFRQTGTSPSGAFAYPERIRFHDSVIEQPSVGAAYSVSHTAGRLNECRDTNLADTTATSARPLVSVSRPNTGNASSSFKFADCDFGGLPAYATFLEVTGQSGAGSSVIMTGHNFFENGVAVFEVDDYSQVYDAGMYNNVLLANVGAWFVNAPGGVLLAQNLILPNHYRPVDPNAFYIPPTETPVVTYESFPRQAGNVNNIALPAGTPFLVAFQLSVSTIVHNIGFIAGATGFTAGATSNDKFFGITDSSRNVLALTADDGATAWAQGTVKQLAIATNGTGGSITQVTLAPFTTYYAMIMVAAVGTSFVQPNLFGRQATASGTAIAPPLNGDSASTGVTTPGTCPTPLGAITAVSGAPYFFFS